jgi:hypothetical protein
VGFSFTATAECDDCGQLLSASDEVCDHNGETVDEQAFRRLESDTFVVVEATPSFKWHKLAREQGEDWIAYQYLGTAEQVESMLSDDLWGSVSELPRVSISTTAPSDVPDEVDE